MLKTLFHEIESSINKRPLTYCSDDRDELISPADFSSGTSVHDSIDSMSHSDVLRKGIRERKDYFEMLWRRLKNDYPFLLRPWNNEMSFGKKLLAVSDVVIVHPKSINLTNWQCGLWANSSRISRQR